jgi:protein-S-isoprenylcysteine O-methyltransferase Ste14
MMKASPLEFRFRFLILALIYLLGFVAPWNYALHLDTIRTWQLLAAWLYRTGWISFSSATIAILVLGIVVAFVAALLRTWGSAYLGNSIVHSGGLHGDQMVAAGPYRWVRNPLYIGTFLHTLVLALLMPPSGAVFCTVAVGIFQWRLIGAEEDFLSGRLGEAYVAYCARVPRLVPALRPRVVDSAVRPAWGFAILGEVYMWGVVVAFAVAGWRYDSQLIIQGVIISLGVSLVVRAFLPKR